jgi:hypothetical protein
MRTSSDELKMLIDLPESQTPKRRRAVGNHGVITEM